MGPKPIKRVRRSESVAGPSQKQVRRDLAGEEDAILKPWSRQPGMILKVHLKNFMCHQEYVYSPNQCLNFLSGANGSGKSAVMTAIVFALGGSARTSNRGTSNKGFIRNGANQMSVEVTLLNEGENAFKPHIYGNQIMVHRYANLSGGGGYVK